MCSSDLCVPASAMTDRLVRKKRTEVTIQTHRIFTIPRRAPPPRAWCEQCSRVVERVTPDEAAAITGVNPRAIYRHLEAGDLHFIEGRGGAVWICVRSL